MGITIITSGYYKVYKDDLFYSNHTKEQKAIETALNLILSGEKNIYILYPDKLKVELEEAPVSDTTPPAIPTITNIIQ